MCKHILNAQVSIRAPCCQRFFDCPQCHAENSDHELKRATVMVFACKKCKKCFRKDLKDFDEEADSHCPHCDNQYILDAVTPESKPKGKMVLELEQSSGARARHELDVAELDKMLEEELNKM